MTQSRRLLRRLFLLGIVQLFAVALVAAAVGFLTRPGGPLGPFALPPRPPPPGMAPLFGPPPPHGPPPFWFFPPMLVLIGGVAVIALGAAFTARWMRKLLLVEKELLANVSHELRTPLARIRVALDLASEGDAATAQASLREIATDLGELEALLEDVLTSTRLELAAGKDAGGFPLHLEELTAKALAERAAERFQAGHPKRPLDLSIADGETRVAADPRLFGRVLANLLENAHKYTPDPAKPVRLRVERMGASASFVVSDEGIGIAESDLPHLFTPFFRGDRSRSRGTGGVGLGLSLAQRIAHAHRGEIRVESTAAVGTKVRVTLPAL